MVKKNQNFGGILLALIRDHHGGTAGTGGMDGTLVAANVTGPPMMLDWVLIQGGGGGGSGKKENIWKEIPEKRR